MNTCELVNLGLGENLAHALRPTTEPNLNAIITNNMYLRNIRVLSSRHYQMGIVSNTSATAETVDRLQEPISKPGKLILRTKTGFL